MCLVSRLAGAYSFATCQFVTVHKSKSLRRAGIDLLYSDVTC